MSERQVNSSSTECVSTPCYSAQASILKPAATALIRCSILAYQSHKQNAPIQGDEFSPVIRRSRSTRHHCLIFDQVVIRGSQLPYWLSVAQFSPYYVGYARWVSAISRARWCKKYFVYGATSTLLASPTSTLYMISPPADAGTHFPSTVGRKPSWPDTTRVNFLPTEITCEQDAAWPSWYQHHYRPTH